MGSSSKDAVALGEDTRWDGSKSENYWKASRVRRTLPDIATIGDSHILACHQICRELWLWVVTDGGDTWKYYPPFMIQEAQQVWEERLELFETEMKRRNLKPSY